MLAQKDIFIYEDFLYIFISKDIRYFAIYQSELLNFVPDTPGLLTLLENFANVTVYIFNELSEQDKLEIFDLVEKNIKNDNYVGTAFLTGFIETIQNVSSKEQYKKIEKYFGKETLLIANELIEFLGI
ncbi:DUF7674 family protein [Campylobacter concisus]|uniref:DUF7674 domain-containing protein n=1 Tax=Campylobacter concisus TaxID=199 RepID=A0A1Y5MSZ9_9BACT|nr:hypothetical protein [Campylobacter concisus]MBE9836496.1 hypothetical protein [Campylobacter concisus]MBS5810771.1 hypothetical protein [Campylobacter concisus]OUT08772.1 hypothetical protein B9N65_00055 [Campylobacter concisus]